MPRVSASTSEQLRWQAQHSTGWKGGADEADRAGPERCRAGAELPVGQAAPAPPTLTPPCLRHPSPSPRWTHRTEFVRITDPHNVGVALKVVEQLELIIARHAKELASASLCWRAYVLHTLLLEALDDILREGDERSVSHGELGVDNERSWNRVICSMVPAWSVRSAQAEPAAVGLPT